MSLTRALTGRLALPGAAVLALAAAAPPPASAADACPNAAVRAQQGSAHLPDCRAYEQVSPVDKNGNAVRFSVMPRAGGDAIAYWSTGAFADAQSSVMGYYSGRRTADGWQTTSLSPPTLTRPPAFMDVPYVVDMSEDFSRALLITRYPVDPDDQAFGDIATTGQTDVYRREADGAFTWLSHGPVLPDRQLIEVFFGAATSDLEQVVFATAKPLLPQHADAAGTQQLYLRDGDALSLVSVGPDGRPLPRGASLGRSDASPGSLSGSTVGGELPSAVSGDGDTIFFSDRTSTSAQPAQLYARIGARDPATAATVHVSRSHASGSEGAGCGAEAKFLAATDDGGTVWFGCRSQLTDDASAGGGVYEYDVASDELRFVTPSSGGEAVNTLAFVAADPAVDHLWFVSGGAFGGGAQPNQQNLYVLHDGRVRFVAALDFADPITGESAPTVSSISPDGARLAFSARTQLDPRAAETEQVYLADAAAPDPRPVCVSCRPDGSPSRAKSGLLTVGGDEFLASNRTPPRGNVGADGQVFFTSADALVPEDRNEVADVYEQRDGELRLLSSGTGDLPAVLVGASRDSTDVFLVTSQRLAAQDVDNSVADVYSVRVGGGFLAPPPAPDCGEGCQGPPRPPASPPTPASASFSGPRDVFDRVPPRAPSLRLLRIAPKQRAAWAARGRTTVTARFSHAGTVRALVRGRIGRRALVVARASATVARGGSARLTLRLSRRARIYLQRHRALSVTVTVRHSRVAAAQRTSLTLRAPAAGAKRGGRR